MDVESVEHIFLFIKGNLTTNGDIQIEGEVEGNIKANLLTIGKDAKFKGELNTDELIVNGHVSGTIRAKKVTLTSSAKVEGDIIHHTLAIETGAPLSTSEVTQLLGSRPGSPKTERGGLIARRISRNVWKLNKAEKDNSHWRN